MSEKLKPCSCGSKAIPFSIMGDFWEIVCETNDCERGPLRDSREEAIKAWNRRAVK